MPGRRFSILYVPLASVVAERTFSIKAGLLASTVTPGNTAPVASFTVPANALCARAVAGSASHASTTTNNIGIRLLVMPVPPQSRSYRPVCAGDRLMRRGEGIYPEFTVNDRSGRFCYGKLD